MDLHPHKELTLGDLMVIFQRRRQVVYRVIAVSFLLAILYCVFSTRMYEAKSTIEVLSRGHDMLGVESLTGAAQGGEPDPVSVNVDLQTQANILQSETLALKIISDLHMEDSADFKGHWNPVSWVLGLLSPSGSADTPNSSLENSPQRRRRALLVFSKHLSVQPINGTRLLTISYVSSDAKLAASVVNELSQSLIDYSFQSRFDATNQAANWLSGQLNALRQQSEALQKHAAELENKSQVFDLGPMGSEGHGQTYVGAIDQLQQASAALTQAQQNRILRGAIAHAAESGDAEMLSGLAGNSTAAAPTGNSLALIQVLRGQEASQEAALLQAETKYGSAYPKLAELRGNISGLQKSIQQEISRIQGRAKSDFEVAIRAEDETRNHYLSVKAQADKLNSSAVELTLVKQEADGSSKLYQDLLRKLKEAGVLGQLKGSLLSVVDPGRIPGKPLRPNVPLYLAASIVGGAFLGLFLALLIEVSSTRINSIHDVEVISGNDLFGILPAFNNKSVGRDAGETPPLLVTEKPQSSFAEAIRAIRTAILMKEPSEASKTILVTSSIAGEGKTTVATNLAILLAQAGKSVLLVDADIRNGVLAQVFNIPPGVGFSELLTGAVETPEITPVSAYPNLHVLRCGKSFAHGSELLVSGSVDRWLSVWKANFDHVILDSPGLLPSADAMALAKLADIRLLVVRSGLTEGAQFRRSYELLTDGHRQSVTVILNGIRREERIYASYFGLKDPELV